MLSFGARVTARIIEKPLVGLSKTIFPKTKTVVKKILNQNLPKGEQIVKRTIPRNDITSFANVHYFDLSKQSGEKILKAFDKDGNLLAEGMNVIKQLMQKGKRTAEFWYRHH